MPLDDGPAKGAVPQALKHEFAGRLSATRLLSLEIAAPLTIEDQAVQAMDDTSPTKWHLAHTSWFFEEMVLKQFQPGYRVFDEGFAFCFNSYYESLGARHPRPRRGLLTRPTVEEVRAYRAYVDENLNLLLAADAPEEAYELIEIGINHEQQHQELMLTDILALFAANPLRPVYRDAVTAPREAEGDGIWEKITGGIYEIGHRSQGFAYDNEAPPHKVLLQDFRIFSREVTNGEWIAFIEAGGYSDPSLWLSDGWATARREGWIAPGYWELKDRTWHRMTLQGLKPVEARMPAVHVSFYEADAFARWAGCRLPTEFEWEVASANEGAPAPLDLSRLHPKPAQANGRSPLLGNLWQWTGSAYLPYPGYRVLPGALGEYNGKFMCNQFVLRGGSFATPDGHLRRTYRNFFYPHQRWQFMGVRLASNA